MYAKCGGVEEAWIVFNKIPSQDVVTWTTMISGHVQCEQGQKVDGAVVTHVHAKIVPF
jgi:hypothetical protein